MTLRVVITPSFCLSTIVSENPLCANAALRIGIMLLVADLHRPQHPAIGRRNAPLDNGAAAVAVIATGVVDVIAVVVVRGIVRIAVIAVAVIAVAVIGIVVIAI